MATPRRKSAKLPNPVLHSDNLGDLIAEGSVHIDDILLLAVIEEERAEARRKAAAATDYLDDPNWNPSYTIVDNDF